MRRGLLSPDKREHERSGMTTTELRRKIRAVPMSGLFSRLLAG